MVPSLNGKEIKRNRFGCDRIYGKVVGKAQREGQTKEKRKAAVEPGRVRWLGLTVGWWWWWWWWWWWSLAGCAADSDLHLAWPPFVLPIHTYIRVRSLARSLALSLSLSRALSLLLAR